MRRSIYYVYPVHALLAFGLVVAIIRGSAISLLMAITLCSILYGILFAIWLRDSFPRRISTSEATVILENMDAYTINDKRSAANSLRGIGADSLVLLPQMIDKLKTEDVWVRRSLLLAIGQLGSEAGPAVDSLEKILVEDDNCAIIAAIAVGRIGTVASACAPAIERRLNVDKDLASRLLYAESFLRVGGNTKIIIPVVVEGLLSSRRRVMRSATRLVTYMGHQGKQVVNAINDLLSDESVKTRRAARRAIRMLARVN